MEHPITVYITADSLISSLGVNTRENIEAIRKYRSGITPHEAGDISDAPILAATINREFWNTVNGLDTYTRLEQLFILTIQDILSHSGISLADEDCGLILSTTKGNIDLLSGHPEEPDIQTYLWEMGRRIGGYFQANDRVEIISNACISGVSALIVAKRWIEYGKYKKVIVAGGDLLSHFITSGFLSFKSISSQICRPYDARRNGLNLGEACGAVLLSSEGKETDIILSGGAISNDANHISGPSRTGDGLYFAIRQAMEEASVTAGDVSFVNAHGTATAYNDEMESKAIHLAGLETVPVNSMKSYFGHTLGASGVIESIICIHELKGEELFGTLGYEESGVSMPIIVRAEHQEIPMKHCVKTASGFGGCNAAIVLTIPEYQKQSMKKQTMATIHTTATVSIENSGLRMNGATIFSSSAPDFAQFIREAYKNTGGSNLKFYKMDDLCKLGYIAAEYLLKEKNFQPEEIGILLANSASSLNTDIHHQAIINQGGDHAASPTVFVYTLPNVVAGEICIRHKIQGENTFFIEKEFDAGKLEEYARIVMEKGKLKACITGWCNFLKGEYKADFKLIEVQH
ncbi:beta-ketoacyl synthase N-terminal-like domain-containing protein [uncultured Bacteroides sp.]|uniref:beta-ketoacyl synthase N-terminal-like domain-containing protein n=1 Tax=uncultured Bacteroides sp. TaxID=162156 RepID=UPI00258A35DF|nr:beta-ketoacyl synthase N-terminal-like domain-containing protein [uncultured Bacteroides sp.]